MFEEAAITRPQIAFLLSSKTLARGGFPFSDAGMFRRGSDHPPPNSISSLRQNAGAWWFSILRRRHVWRGSDHPEEALRRGRELVSGGEGDRAAGGDDARCRPGGTGLRWEKRNGSDGFVSLFYSYNCCGQKRLLIGLRPRDGTICYGQLFFQQNLLLW